MSPSVLQRYVLRELTAPFLAATAMLLSLFYAMMLVRGVEFLLGSAAGVSDWLMLAGAMLPLLLPQVLPIAMLLGVMIGFARLGEDGELTAMSALGVSPVALVRPALILAVCVSALLAVTLFFWKPWGVAQMRNTARAVIERNVLGDLKPGTVRSDLPGIVFHAAGVSAGPTWKEALLIDEREADRVAVLSAPLAKATFEEGVGIAFTKGVLVQRDGAGSTTTTSFDEGTLLLNVGEAVDRRDTFRFGPDELGPVELLDRVAQAEAAGEPTALYWSALHFRFSQLIAPIALGVLATAIAVGGRRRAARTAALMAFGTYVAFFVTARIGVQLGERGVFPPWLAGHLPTALTLAVAIVLLMRVERRGHR
ncbi:MAG: LptF/LptG family permease [Archangium sp.]